MNPREKSQEVKENTVDNTSSVEVMDTCENGNNKLSACVTIIKFSYELILIMKNKLESWLPLTEKDLWKPQKQLSLYKSNLKTVSYK